MSLLFGLMRSGERAVEHHELAAMAGALGVSASYEGWRRDGAALAVGVAAPPGAPGAPGAAAGASAGTSLVANRDDSLALILDGHVDDRRELGRALGLAASAARTLPASELVLLAYERWREGCLQRLVGEFSFVLWDRRLRTLTAGCSAPLARPLFFHASHDLVAFAGLARGLFALPHIARRVDELRVAGFLTGVDTGAHRSFFRDVTRLLPGEVLTVDAAGPRVARWWRPDLKRRIVLSGPGEYAEAFRDVFQAVLDDHLADAGRTGIMVSGGLDSSSVAALAAPSLARSARRLAAYTEVPPPDLAGELPPGRYADETPFVRALAAMYPNIDLTLVRAGGHGLLHEADRMFAATEVPFRNAANRGWVEAIYARAGRAGVTTLLNGDHGNLTASWNGSGRLAELCRQRRPRAAFAEARASAGARSGLRNVVRHGLVPLLPVPARAALAGVRMTLDSAHPAYPRGEALIAPGFAAEVGLGEAEVRRHVRERMALQDDSHASRVHVLVRAGVLAAQWHAGCRARYGVNTRTPLADRRLLEFTLQVPETQYAQRGEDRLLIRRAMAGRLPSETLASERRGLQAADWWERITREREELLATVARFDGDELTRRVLDLPRLRALLERWPDRSAAELGLHRGAVGVALMTGSFLLWAQGD